jgi:hypothetical protein
MTLLARNSALEKAFVQFISFIVLFILPPTFVQTLRQNVGYIQPSYDGRA